MQGAPGGTVEEAPKGDLLSRLRGEPSWFSHAVHTLPFPGLSAPLRLLQLTDVHIRKDGPWLQALCELLAPLETDLLLLTGDIVTRGWKREAAGRFLRALPKARLGSFAIMGNWEYWGGAQREPWRDFLAEHGVRLLQNEATRVGELGLAGIDDLLAGEPDLDKAIAELPPGLPAVVLTHSPALFPLLARPPVRLVLSGHTHAGQVRIPGLGAPFLPLGTGPYVGGWYRERGVDLFVGRGVGWSIAPVRLWCPPELAEIRLVPIPGA